MVKKNSTYTNRHIRRTMDPTRGFSVLLLYRDYVSPLVAICAYASVYSQEAFTDSVVQRVASAIWFSILIYFGPSELGGKEFSGGIATIKQLTEAKDIFMRF